MMSLLTVDRATERFGTSTRFVRRLVAERRIPFTKLGRHVRPDTFIIFGRVEALSAGRQKRVGA